MSWLLADRLLRIVLLLIVEVFLARYLGVENFGKLNYAIALVGLFLPFSTLGLPTIVIRDIVENPLKTNEIMGTAFICHLIGGFIFFVLANWISLLINHQDGLILSLIFVLSFSGFFQSFNVIDYWFQSQVQSRYVVWIKSSSAIFFSFLKLAAIALHFPITGFSWLILGELIASAFGMSLFFFKKNLLSWSFDLSLAKSFFKESYPLIISSFAIIIYVKIDQVMLGQMVGNKAVGIYSLAARLSEAWYFIPAIITSSVLPSVIEAKKNSDLLYRQRIKKLYSLMVFVAIFVAFFVTIFSDSIIILLFGKPFIDASPILKVHIWAAVFVFLGGASSQWLLLEKLNKYGSYRVIIGCIFNIGLNLLLIPWIGGLGAAFATLISYFISTFSLVFFKKTRQCTLDMASAFNPVNFFYSITTFSRFLKRQ